MITGDMKKQQQQLPPLPLLLLWSSFPAS